MFKISNHICSELENSKVILKKLELTEREKILDLALKKYIDSSKTGGWLWEKFIRYEALNDNMAWGYIKYFVSNNECVMFFNQEEEKEMFLLQSGEDLDYILSETYGFEFYVTDKQCTYLFCFNHHDILYGCGTAESWVNSIKRRSIESK